MYKEMLKIVNISKIIILFLVIGLLIVSGINWSKNKNSFAYPNFIISGNKIIDDSEYQEYLAKISITNLYDYDNTDLAMIIERHPYVAGVRVSKHFPNNILVEISERYPIALINNDPLLMVDNISTILPFRSNSFDFQIPIISNFDFGFKSSHLGKKTEYSNLLIVVAFLDQLKTKYPDLYNNLSEIRLNHDNDYELILEDEPTKIILGNSINWSKIQILQEFEKNIYGQKKLSDYVYLDLRYNNQVIIKERDV
jgi:cell division septal protein FtsQ